MIMFETSVADRCHQKHTWSK